jgi:hypothetical protein
MPNTLIETIAAGFSVAESDSPAAPAVRKVLQEFDYASLVRSHRTPRSAISETCAWRSLKPALS